MSCNTCTKPFSLLRKEKGCPGCGYSYCSKCLSSKMFLEKINAVAKVCAKCKNSDLRGPANVEPPNIYYKRLQNTGNNQGQSENGNIEDKEILNRLKNLKSKDTDKKVSDSEIATRLKVIKGEQPSISNDELYERLAKLKGVSAEKLKSMPYLPPPDIRTEQEQADDLMKQYLEETKVDSKYKDEFDALVGNIEQRLNKLKQTEGINHVDGIAASTNAQEAESEDEEEIVKKIIEKIKSEPLLEDEFSPTSNTELPFCEICNEDANMRCLGCKYLFCKRCWLEHKDDDDDCNRYEPFEPSKQ